MSKEKNQLENLTPEQGVVIGSDLTENLPLQKVEIVRVLKYINRDKNNPRDVNPSTKEIKQPYQGYIIKFIESDAAVVVSGGAILKAQQDSKVEAFEVTTKGTKKFYDLVATEMGLEKVGRGIRVILAKN
jgi:hypothetical protein